MVERDITVRLADLDLPGESKNVIQEAIKEIIDLRMALKPFAHWSSAISWDNILTARGLLYHSLNGNAALGTNVAED